MVSLKFHDLLDLQDYLELMVSEDKDVLYISILSGALSTVAIDKSTAIKLSKELRKQIALLD
jgi:hypothetical protein